MITLGINAAFHDSAAALVRDGQLVAAAEEERFTRIKHGKRPVPFSAWELPFNAIDYCLREAGVTAGRRRPCGLQLRPATLRRRTPAATARALLPMDLSPHSAGAWESPWDPLFALLPGERAAPTGGRRAAPPARALQGRAPRRAVPVPLRRPPPVPPGQRIPGRAVRTLRGDDARRPRRRRDDGLRPLDRRDATRRSGR